MLEAAAVSLKARRAYTARLSGDEQNSPWWDAVVVTASSARQAERYMDEIRRRQQQSKVPQALYLTVADPGNRRIGSGGATLNALRILAPALGRRWRDARVLIIHSGGDSRRLPQYSLSGKLFGALPVRTPWGEVSTVFDEFLARSCGWVEQLPSGLVVASGDVVLTFDAAELDWSRPGATGVALRQPVQVGSQHGVYIADPGGRVYTYLQKPSASEVAAAGGILTDGAVAVDTGLIRFDPEVTAELAAIGKAAGEAVPFADLYRHFTMALAGQWKVAEDEDEVLRRLHRALSGQPFWCCLMDGDFTHIGTTRSFREIVTENTSFSSMYEGRQRLDVVVPEGVRCAGVIIDCVLAPGSDLGPGSIAIECDLRVAVSLGQGAILHGASDLDGEIEVPDGVVMHQVPVAPPDETRGTVVRVFSVEDDPKAAAWFGRPLTAELQARGMDPEMVWPGVPHNERILWNADLFPVGTVAQAWCAAKWLAGFPEDYSVLKWAQAHRMSLATSAQHADMQRVSELHIRRMQSAWGRAAVKLMHSGADIRPLLANAPGVSALVAAARAAESGAAGVQADAATFAASRQFQASMFYAKAGLADESERLQSAAFECVQAAVQAGSVAHSWVCAREWAYQEVVAEAPPRIDLGGGWSDTPPFCLDWGGAVLNIAVELDGRCPIRSRIRCIDEPVIRCCVGEPPGTVTFSTAEQVLAPPQPGSPFTIARVALAIAGIVNGNEDLRRTLCARGGGLEITTEVDLPMGSGLGTSSILAATLVSALAGMSGVVMSEARLIDEVMRLEQRMTTGGGWQDQVGGIYPGAKLITSGPGLRQRLRVEPVAWSAEREREFVDRLVLYNTRLQRMAKNLLRQVVGRYLAREVEAVQILHGIKTLAMEMAFAMRDGDWEYLGHLLDRHWDFNRLLDPNTTNAPINSVLSEVRPYISGAKLAGAGGGGYLILLAKDAGMAIQLRQMLGSVEAVTMAQEGLRVRKKAWSGQREGAH